MLQSMGSRRVRQDCTTELTELLTQATGKTDLLFTEMPKKTKETGLFGGGGS